MLPRDPGEQFSSVQGPERGPSGPAEPKALGCREADKWRRGGHGAPALLRVDTLDYASCFKIWLIPWPF